MVFCRTIFWNGRLRAICLFRLERLLPDRKYLFLVAPSSKPSAAESSVGLPVPQMARQLSLKMRTTRSFLCLIRSHSKGGLLSIRLLAVQRKRSELSPLPFAIRTPDSEQNDFVQLKAAG